MIVGFYLNAILSNTHKPGVQGDELWANALVKGLKELYPENEYYVFGENLGFLPKVDVAIYFDMFRKKYGEKNIYIQQNYSDNPDAMAEILKYYKDKEVVATISSKYGLENAWKLLYPAIDEDIYHPVKFSIEHNNDIFYAGNNIKRNDYTKALLTLPGAKYGIYGNGFTKNLSYEKLKYYYSSAILSLNIPFNKELDVITAKPFQIASCKGIVVSPYTHTLKEVFGDSIYLLDIDADIHYQMKNILDELKRDQNKILEKREKAYKTAQGYNYKVQAKNFWEWIKSCLL